MYLRSAKKCEIKCTTLIRISKISIDLMFLLFRKRSEFFYEKIHKKTPVSELHVCNFVKKETVTLAFSCAFCEFFKNAFFKTHPLVTASDCFSVFSLKMFFRSTLSKMFYKITVIKNFAKFVGKHFRCSLFFNNAISWRLFYIWLIKHGKV